MSKINGWQFLPLEDLTSLIKDGTHGTHQDIESGVPLLSAKDIRNGYLEIPNDCRRISFIDYLLIHKNYEIAKNDILLTIVGSIGRCYLVSGSDPRFTIQRSVAVIRPKSINANYLYHYFLSEIFQRNLKNSINASAQGGVYLGTLANCLVNFPTCKEEQEQIAAVLSTLDRAIAQTEAIIAKQQRIKTGLMQDLLTKGIDENGNIRSETTHKFKDSALGRIPVEWEVKKIQEAGELKLGRQTAPKYQVGINPCLYLRVVNIYDGQLDLRDIKTMSFTVNEFKVYCLEYGDVLLTEGDLVSAMNVGRSAIFRGEIERCCFQNSLIRFRPFPQSSSEFFHFLFCYLRSVGYFANATMATTVFHLSVGRLQDFCLSVPPKLEQIRIAEILCKQDQNINIESKKYEKLILLKTGLMQDLLTGKVRVTNLLKEKEPTSP